MIHITDNPEKLSFWQLIISQSNVNGAPYHGEELRRHNWEWPEDTYLQRRLQYLKESQSPDLSTSNLSAEARFELLYKKLLEEYQYN
ncbi:MAG: hypothetical protein HY694_08015 [Deltaproteobacteria bacterium]|nr:hypothetical protein [Deltaproteobacteria bacterium]